MDFITFLFRFRQGVPHGWTLVVSAWCDTTPQVLYLRQQLLDETVCDRRRGENKALRIGQLLAESCLQNMLRLNGNVKRLRCLTVEHVNICQHVDVLDSLKICPQLAALLTNNVYLMTRKHNNYVINRVLCLILYAIFDVQLVYMNFNGVLRQLKRLTKLDVDFGATLRFLAVLIHASLACVGRNLRLLLLVADGDFIRVIVVLLKIVAVDDSRPFSNAVTTRIR